MSIQNEFSVGDKVKYVGTGWDEIFERDIEYPVTEVWFRGCNVDGNPVSNRFYNDFEIVKDTPKAQDNSWYENGELPPVGSKVIFYSDDFDNEGFWHNRLTNNSEVKIIAHFATDGSETLDIAAFTFRYENDWIQVEQAVACCFRPIKTAEDIAEEERQNTINKMLEIVKGSCALFDAERAKVEALYAAGLRFVGEDK